MFDSATGEQLQKLTADDAAEGDQFGNSVAISGDLAIVGAHLDDAPGSNSGSAYVFQPFQAPCPADFTGADGSPDGTVDVHDLLTLLAAWGPCD
ncbi:MAG: hypothetical protein GY842_18280 [bacterium]|nr:hypothetical protein [bacterium]